MNKLVFFASGSGSNFQAVIDAIENNEIDADISGLITDNENAGAILRAKNHNININVIRDFGTDLSIEQLVNQLSEWQPDLIVLAGFLKKIPDEITRLYPNKIINIHPSLLPKYGGKGFYGNHVHQAVLDYGDTLSGCTVHFVNEKYDEGKIIKQKTVDVLPNDTAESLANRVLSEEHKLLPEVIKQILNQTN
ncbi:MAG: phosphoribosylglycinamide formyltransferase [Balneolaceae bacterium]|nr:phosphoribosylglycinamide formyltransferase [Balneolaceae bacterium]